MPRTLEDDCYGYEGGTYKLRSPCLWYEAAKFSIPAKDWQGYLLQKYNKVTVSFQDPEHFFHDVKELATEASDLADFERKLQVRHKARWEHWNKKFHSQAHEVLLSPQLLNDGDRDYRRRNALESMRHIACVGPFLDILATYDMTGKYNGICKVESHLFETLATRKYVEFLKEHHPGLTVPFLDFLLSNANRGPINKTVPKRHDPSRMRTRGRAANGTVHEYVPGFNNNTPDAPNYAHTNSEERVRAAENATLHDAENTMSEESHIEVSVEYPTMAPRAGKTARKREAVETVHVGDTAKVVQGVEALKSGKERRATKNVGEGEAVNSGQDQAEIKQARSEGHVSCSAEDSSDRPAKRRKRLFGDAFEEPEFEDRPYKRRDAFEVSAIGEERLNQFFGDGFDDGDGFENGYFNPFDRQTWTIEDLKELYQVPPSSPPQVDAGI